MGKHLEQLLKIYYLPRDVTGIYQITWISYMNGKLKDYLIETFHDTKDGILISRECGKIHMSLTSIIISEAAREIVDSMVIGYLIEKAANIGIGKIWTELKKKIGNNSDLFEL